MAVTKTATGGEWLTSNWLSGNWLQSAGYASIPTEIEHLVLYSKTVRLQINASAYNSTNLRILWELASDGIVSNNFTASSEASIDKGVKNLKSDIVERYWQTTSSSNQWFTFDGGAGRLLSIDTLAFIEHNLTSSAVVTIKGSGGSGDAAPGDWSVVPVYASIPMPADRPTETRLFWCSPVAPSSQYRHWRVDIHDPTNPDGFIRVGRFVAGSALILQGENISGSLEHTLENYKDKIELNGFTSIANNRALKQTIRLTLDRLNTQNAGNYPQLMRMIRYCRDTLKVLVIPDPQNIYDYSVYARLGQMPRTQSNFTDSQNIYASMELIFDEAK
jgi:hypothetical protein